MVAVEKDFLHKYRGATVRVALPGLKALVGVLKDYGKYTLFITQDDYEFVVFKHAVIYVRPCDRLGDHHAPDD